MTQEAPAPRSDLSERLAREAPAVHAIAYGILFDRIEAAAVTRTVLAHARNQEEENLAPTDPLALDRAASQFAFTRRSFLHVNGPSPVSQSAGDAPGPGALGAVRSALESLPADHRTALLQHVMAHLSANAIAERRSLATAAVRAALFRAWRSLERKLNRAASDAPRPRTDKELARNAAGDLACRRAESLLWLAATGELTKADEGRLNEHVGACGTCSARLHQIEGLTARVRGALEPQGWSDQETVELARPETEDDHLGPDASQVSSAPSRPGNPHLGRHIALFLSALFAAAALCGALWPRPAWGPTSNGLRAGLDAPVHFDGSGPLRLTIRLQNAGRRPLRVALAGASWDVTVAGPDDSTFLVPLQAAEDPVQLDPGQAFAKPAKRDYVLRNQMRVDLHTLPSGRYRLRGRYIHLPRGAASHDLWTGRLVTNTVEIRITRP